MEPLHEPLAELADDPPTGGEPAAGFWARGKRARRLRMGALAATVLVVGVVGTGIGVRLADGDDRGDASHGEQPAGPIDVTLPIVYPVGQELPDLGDAPGRLVAVWVTPRAGGGAPEIVGLVAETGAFGTLPIEARVDVGYRPSADPGLALSPDGRRIAYAPLQGEEGAVVVHDLVSGEEEFPAIENDGLFVYDWFDATHLYGNAGSYDSNGWVWEPGKAAKLVDFVDYPSPGAPYLGQGWPFGGTALEVQWQGRPSRLCAQQPVIREAASDDPQRQAFVVSVLCDVVGVVDTEILLGYWNPAHLAGEPGDPKYADGTLVALDIHDTDRPHFDLARPRRPAADDAFDDPALRRVVVTSGAPYRVALATHLIAEALESAGGGS